jgi:hypothetical protein
MGDTVWSSFAPLHKRAACIGAILLVAFGHGARGQSATGPLPGTSPLTIDKPIDEVMVAGISRFALRALQQSPQQRDALWARNYTRLRKTT